MKKLLLLLMLFGSVMVFSACDDRETEAEERIENVGDDIEDGAENMGEDIEDAVED